jgi:hypothetical protein
MSIIVGAILIFILGRMSHAFFRSPEASLAYTIRSIQEANTHDTTQ